MRTSSKILFVEDSPADVELLQYELKKGGIIFEAKVVQNEQDYETALRDFAPDIILCDFSLPFFDGPSAFRIREEIAPSIPFIFVSGSIGEENSVEYIKNGVTDYALKDKLFTLTSKVTRALKDSEEKQLKDKTEQERILSEVRLARAQQLAHMGSWELDFNTNNVCFSDEACRIYGLGIDENCMSLNKWISFIYSDDKDLVLTNIEKSRASKYDFSFDYRIIQKNGAMRHVYSECRIETGLNNRATELYGITHDITESKRAAQDLRKSESSLKEAQAIAQVGNWEIDLMLNTHYWSDEIYHIFGVSKNEISPSEEAFMAFTHPDDLEPTYKIIENGFQTLENISFDFRFIRKDGEVRHGYNEWKFKFDQKGDPECLMGIFQDITDRKLAETERTKMVNDLMVRNKDLEQFSYIVSHNLRAPVANILGATSVLNDPELTVEDKEILNKGIFDSVTGLDTVIRDLDDILQIKASIDKPKELVRFSEIVNEIKTSIQSQIDKEHIKIISDFSKVDEFLTLKSYLYSVFYNLISNSIKYCKKGLPCVIDIKSRVEKNKLTLVFTDNGMGIDLEKRGDQIFGLYKRFHQDIEGKGIGLFMVKTQVETLGGKISVSSEVDKGTEFKIEFER